MSKKRNYFIEYNLMVNGEEFEREYTVRAVANKEAAEAKLRKLCTVELVIRKTIEV